MNQKQGRCKVTQSLPDSTLSLKQAEPLLDSEEREGIGERN